MRREDYDIILRATDQTAPAFSSAERNAESFGGAIGKLKTGLEALAGVIAAERIADFVREAVSSLADLGSRAKTVGVTTDALQALRYEMRQAGGDTSVMDGALEKFADSASKAGTGGNYLAKVFQANGVAVKDANGQVRSASDLLEDYAKLVTNAGSAQDKVRLSVEAFGKKDGPAMVDVLERIAKDGLPAVIKSAQDAGVIIDKSLIEKAEETEKKWRQSSDRIQAFLKTTAVSVIDSWDKLFEEDTALSQLIRMIQGKEKFSITIDLSPEPGSFGDWLWQKLRGGAAAVLGEPTPTFNDRFPTDALNPPSKNTALVDQIKDYLKLTDVVVKAGDAMAETGRKTRLPLQNDALQKAIDSVTRHVAVMEADALAVNKTAGEHEYLRVKMQLLQVAQQNNIPVTGEYAKRIEDLANRARGAADALAAAKLKSDLLFEREQLGRSDIEAAVAARLRGAQIDPMSAQGEFLAQQIRVNEALTQTRDLSRDALKGFINDMRQGKSAGEAFSNVLNRITDKLIDMAVNDLVAAAFNPGGVGGGAGGALGGFLGGIGKLFGFAEGGEFRVGGSGGTDSQLVAFRASPDETVRISKPGQSGGGTSISMPISINAQGASEAGLARVAMELRDLKENLPKTIATVTRNRQVRGVMA